MGHYMESMHRCLDDFYVDTVFVIEVIKSCLIYKNVVQKPTKKKTLD
jgi:hypothetical protein